MSTVAATMSMLETMPETEQVKVFEFTQKLFRHPAVDSPFKPLTADEILADLEISRKQNESGEGLNMKDALTDMGKKHGYI